MPTRLKGSVHGPAPAPGFFMCTGGRRESGRRAGGAVSKQDR